MKYVRIILEALWAGWLAFQKVYGDRRADAESGAAAVDAAAAAAEQKAKEVSDEVDAYTDDELRSAARRMRDHD